MGTIFFHNKDIAPVLDNYSKPFITITDNWLFYININKKEGDRT